MHFSMFNPGIALMINTSEVYHSGLKLDDPVTKERSHDYLLFTSPRKVRGRTESVALLARVPTRFDVWPKDIEDYEFSLQTAANIVAPPVFTGELVKLDKGAAIEAMTNPNPNPNPSPSPNPNLNPSPSPNPNPNPNPHPHPHPNEAMKRKHNLRPFLLDVYNVEYKYD